LGKRADPLRAVSVFGRWEQSGEAAAQLSLKKVLGTTGWEQHTKVWLSVHGALQVWRVTMLQGTPAPLAGKSLRAPAPCRGDGNGDWLGQHLVLLGRWAPLWD